LLPTSFLNATNLLQNLISGYKPDEGLITLDQRADRLFKKNIKN